MTMCTALEETRIERVGDRAADGVAGGEHQAGPGEGAAVARPVARRVAGGATRFGEGVGTGADRGSGDGRVTRRHPASVSGPVALRVQSVAAAVPPPVLSTILVRVRWAVSPA